jgi:hypothetical protein
VLIGEWRVFAGEWRVLGAEAREKEKHGSVDNASAMSSENAFVKYGFLRQSHANPEGGR